MKEIIVGIGEILWDMFPEGKKLGGAPANFAFHAAQFGFESYAISAIGNDDLGKEIINNLDQNELKYILESTSYPTGTVQVWLDEKGVPKYQICENVAWDNIPLTNEMKNLATKTKAVCFGSLAQRGHLSHQTINQFIDLLPTESYRVFDVNLRQNFYSKELILHLLNKCNVLKINEDELGIIAQMMNYPELDDIELIKNLKAVYPHINTIILTKGIKGSYVINAHTESFLQTPIVEVVDTVGAGDAFIAAFIASMLQGKHIEQAHKIAVDLSAFVCTRAGAMPKHINMIG